MRTSRPERTTRVARRASEPGRGRGEGAIPRLTDLQRATRRRGAPPAESSAPVFFKDCLCCASHLEKMMTKYHHPARSRHVRAVGRSGVGRVALLSMRGRTTIHHSARACRFAAGAFSRPRRASPAHPRARPGGARPGSTGARLASRPARLAPGSRPAVSDPARARETGRRRVALAGRHRGYDSSGGRGRGAIVVAPRAARTSARDAVGRLARAAFARAEARR